LKFIRISSLVGLGLPETCTDPLMGGIKLEKNQAVEKGQSSDNKKANE
jgi:hypothetical protein